MAASSRPCASTPDGVPSTGQPRSPANLVSRRADQGTAGSSLRRWVRGLRRSRASASQKMEPSGLPRPATGGGGRTHAMHGQAVIRAPGCMAPGPGPIHPILTANGLRVARSGRPRGNAGRRWPRGAPAAAHPVRDHPRPAATRVAHRVISYPATPRRSTRSHRPDALHRPQNSPSITCSMPQNPTAQTSVRR